MIKLKRREQKKKKEEKIEEIINKSDEEEKQIKIPPNTKEIKKSSKGCLPAIVDENDNIIIAFNVSISHFN
jgi:hypothetical protein